MAAVGYFLHPGHHWHPWLQPGGDLQGNQAKLRQAREMQCRIRAEAGGRYASKITIACDATRSGADVSTVIEQAFSSIPAFFLEERRDQGRERFYCEPIVKPFGGFSLLATLRRPEAGEKARAKSLLTGRCPQKRFGGRTTVAKNEGRRRVLRGTFVCQSAVDKGAPASPISKKRTCPDANRGDIRAAASLHPSRPLNGTMRARSMPCRLAPPSRPPAVAAAQSVTGCPLGCVVLPWAHSAQEGLSCSKFSRPGHHRHDLTDEQK